MPKVRCECGASPLHGLLDQTWVVCPICEGLGWRQGDVSEARAVRAASCIICLGSVDCEACGGTGVGLHRGNRCPSCRGTGECQRCPPGEPEIQPVPVWERLMEDD